jgi:excisionase family DNA binding protein
MNVREVARTLGVSTATVYRLCNDGQLVHVRVANSVRVRPADLWRFVGGRGRV